MDGVNAELPLLAPRQRGDAHALRLHLDQSPFHHGGARDAVQGVLSLTPTSARGGGTTVVARSHREAAAAAAFPPAHRLRDGDETPAATAAATALETPAAARLGGTKRVAEGDAAAQRAKRLARLDPAAAAHDVIVIDDAPQDGIGAGGALKEDPIVIDD